MGIQAIIKQALEADQSGDWKTAHDLVDGHPSLEAAWIHAYLHRKEGDDWNAKYWYRQAGKSYFQGSLEAEWKMLWEELIED